MIGKMLASQMIYRARRRMEASISAVSRTETYGLKAVILPMTGRVTLIPAFFSAIACMCFLMASTLAPRSMFAQTWLTRSTP